MTIRPLAFSAASVAFALLVSTAAAAQSGGGSTAPRTSDGHPDLNGVWDFRTVTPVERPTEFADKESCPKRRSRRMPPNGCVPTTPTWTGKRRN